MKRSISKKAFHRMTVSLEEIAEAFDLPKDAKIRASVMAPEDVEHPEVALLHVEWSESLGFEQTDWPPPPKAESS